MDSFFWIYQCLPPPQQKPVDTECHLEDLPKVMAGRVGWRESQGNPCCQSVLMKSQVQILYKVVCISLCPNTSLGKA